MPVTEAQRAARSERMKERWAAKKRTAQAETPSPADPALQEALAKAPIRSVSSASNGGSLLAMPTPPLINAEPSPNLVHVTVDWEHTPMLAAQQLYATLKSEFERAGRILNARSMERVAGYTCFMCKKHFSGNPGFTDHSYIDPATGLSPRVDCCGELCVINYHKLRIDQNLTARQRQATEQRGE